MLDGRIILTTPRLILRNWRPDDLDPYAAMAADPDVMRWLGGTRTRAKTLSELEGSAHDLTTRGFGKVAVERRADGAFLGMCGLSVEHWYPTTSKSAGASPPPPKAKATPPRPRLPGGTTPSRP